MLIFFSNKMNKGHLDIACFNINSVEISQENGADRVEFCAKID